MACRSQQSRFYSHNYTFFYALLLILLALAAANATIYAPIQTQSIDLTTDLVFKPPRPLYFAPLQLKRKVAGTSPVSFFPVNVLPTLTRSAIRTGFISYLGVLQAPSNSIFILQSPAMYCSAQIQHEEAYNLSTSVVITTGDVDDPEQTFVSGFQYKSRAARNLEIFFYEADFQKTFDTLPVGAEIFIQCPPQVAISDYTSGMNDNLNLAGREIHFFNYETSPTPLNTQIYLQESNSSSSYTMPPTNTNFNQGVRLIGTPTFTVPDNVLDQTSTDPFATITFPFTFPSNFYSYNGYADASEIPLPTNTFQFFTNTFFVSQVVEIIRAKYGSIGIPCYAGSTVVGYFQPSISLQDTSLIPIYSGFQIPSGRVSVNSPVISFSHLTATQSCTFSFQIPLALALSINLYQDSSAIYGVNGFPIVANVIDGSNKYAMLSSTTAYQIPQSLLSDKIPLLSQPSGPIFEILGVRYVNANYLQFKTITDSLNEPLPIETGWIPLVDISISAFVFNSGSTSVPQFCFWKLSDGVIVKATPKTSNSLLNSCFEDQSGFELNIDFSNIVRAMVIDPTSSCLILTAQSKTNQFSRLFRCSVEIPTSYQMSIIWGSQNQNQYPITYNSSDDVIVYDSTVSSFTVVTALGNYFSTTDGQFFNQQTLQSPSIFLKAIPAPQLSPIPTQTQEIATDPNSSDREYFIKLTAAIVPKVGSRLVLRIFFKNISDQFNTYILSNAYFTFGGQSFVFTQTITVGQGMLLIYDDNLPGQEGVSQNLLLVLPLRLNIPFDYDSFRSTIFYDNPWYLTSFNAIRLPTNSLPITSINLGQDPFNLYHLMSTEIASINPIWYSEFYKPISSSFTTPNPQMDNFRRFPTLLYLHLQLQLTNQCTELGLSAENEDLNTLRTFIQDCASSLFLDINLTPWGVAKFEQNSIPHPLSSITTIHSSVNSVQVDPQLPNFQTTQNIQHPSAFTFNVQLGFKNLIFSEIRTSLAENWVDALRAHFQTIPDPPTFTDSSIIRNFDLYSLINTATGLNDILITPVNGAPAIFNQILIPEPSVRGLDGELRSLHPGDIVRYQINWKYFIDNHTDFATVQALHKPSLNSFILLGSFNGETETPFTIPLTVSKIRHSIGFPYSFTVPYFSKQLTHFTIIPRPGIDRPIALYQLWNDHSTITKWYPFSDIIMMQSGFSVPTRASLDLISTKNPAFAVALSNPHNLSSDNQSSYYHTMISMAATSWHWYKDSQPAAYQLSFPQATNSEYSYIFDGPTIDFRRFSIKLLDSNQNSHLQGRSPDVTGSSIVLIYQNSSPFFLKDQIPFVLQGFYEPIDAPSEELPSEEPIDTPSEEWTFSVNNCEHSHFFSQQDMPISKIFCIDTISTRLNTQSTYVTPACPLGTIESSHVELNSIVTYSVATATSVYAQIEFPEMPIKTTVDRSALSPVTIIPPYPVAGSSLPIILLKSRPYQLFSLIVTHVNDLSIPIYPNGLEELPTNESVYPLIWSPFSQYGDKYSTPSSSPPSSITIKLPCIESLPPSRDAITFDYFIAYKMDASDVFSFLQFEPQHITTFDNHLKTGLGTCPGASEERYYFFVTFTSNQAPSSTSGKGTRDTPFTANATPIQTNLMLSNLSSFDQCGALFFENSAYTYLTSALVTRQIQLAMRLQNVFAYVEMIGIHTANNLPDLLDTTDVIISFLHTVDTSKSPEVDLVSSPFGSGFSCDMWNHFLDFPPTLQRFIGCTTDTLTQTDFILGQIYHPVESTNTQNFNRLSIEIPSYLPITQGAPTSSALNFAPKIASTYPQYSTSNALFLKFEPTLQLIFPYSDGEVSSTPSLNDPSQPIQIGVSTTQYSTGSIDFGYALTFTPSQGIEEITINTPFSTYPNSPIFRFFSEIASKLGTFSPNSIEILSDPLQFNVGSKMKITCETCEMSNFFIGAGLQAFSYDTTNTLLLSRSDFFPIKSIGDDFFVEFIPTTELMDTITYTSVHLVGKGGITLLFGDELQTASIKLNPRSYDSSTRTIAASWSYDPNWFTSFDRTIYFRIKLHAIGLHTESDFEWITASYSVTSDDASISKLVQNSYFIPDCVFFARFNIPPLPGFEGFAISLVPINLPSNFNEFQPQFITTISISDSFPIQSVCNDLPICSSCTQNLYHPTGCLQDLTSAASVGVCHDLSCPPHMFSDLTTCSCQCNTPTCLENTRGAMLYLTATGSTPEEKTAIAQRSNTYISSTLKSELSVLLGLNTLPPPLLTTSGSPKRLRGFIDQYSNLLSPSSTIPSVSYAPPVGYESVTLLPIAYTTISSQETVLYISIVPFDGTVANAAFKIALAARFAFLQSRIQLALYGSLNNMGFVNKNSRLISPQIPTPMTINGQTYRSQLINLAAPQSSTASTPAKLTTRCVQKNKPSISTFSCPSITSLTSPFWSACASSIRELTVECVDLAGKNYSFSNSSWCTRGQLFPDFPAVTQLNVCSTSSYVDPTLTLFQITSTPPLLAGSAVSFKWLYPLIANPTFTIDLFISSSPNPNPFVIADKSLQETPIAMSPQQTITSGYSVLLGTFPATQLSATASLPVSLVTIDTQVIFRIRITQAANRPSPPPSNSFLLKPKNLCPNTCIDPNSGCTSTSNGQCICNVNYLLNSTTGLCVSRCTGKCKNNAQCNSSTGLCDCVSPFTGLYCEIDSSCKPQNNQLCNNHGTVLFINNKCDSTCRCFTNWTDDPAFPQTHCNKCTLIDFTTPYVPPFSDGLLHCDPIGTNSTRTPRRGCDKCYCNHGYTGVECTDRVMYGTIRFQSTTTPFAILDAKTVSTELILSTDTVSVLVRDMALSMSLPISLVSLTQAITTITTLPKPSITVAADTSQTQLTFQFQPDDNHNMNNLYDLWKNVQDTLPTTPIGNSDASQELGPMDSMDPAYDPQCDATTETNCPTGTDPFIDQDPEEEEPLIPPPVTSTKDPTTPIVGIIIAVVIGGGVILGTIIIVLCLKKHNRACFKPKKRNDNDHLELTASDQSNARCDDSTTYNNSTKPSKTKSVTATAYSSGSTAAVDLIECETDPDEDPLPPGWKKMKHTGTNEILYINDIELKSLNHHPNHKPANKGKFW